jgi:ketosteroid isomerase-like protein
MRRIHLALIVLFTGSFILSCSDKENKDNDRIASSGLDMKKAKTFIDSINTKWVEELKKGDSTTIASHYGPDAKILLTNGEPLSGSGILAMWGNIIRAGMTDWKFVTTDLEGNSNFLIETGIYEMNSADKKLVDKGNYVVIWKLQPNGEWKLYRDIGVSSMPSPNK